MPQLGLRTQFTITYILLFVAAFISAWFIFSRVLQQQAEDQITYQATVLITMLNSVRTYTNTEVNPLLAPELQTQPKFIPQTVPAFSAREVFENFRKTNDDYQHFLYKEAASNPTNLRDQADSSELALLAQFRANSSLKQLSGFTDHDGEQVFFIAHPLTITSSNCLTCHSDPKSAPASLIATYGTEHGFGWHLNDVIAAQTIYVPAEDIFAQAQQSLALVMGIILAIFGVIIFVMNLGLRRAVIGPVISISRLAQMIIVGKLTPESPELARVNAMAARKDEFGNTARLVQQMVKEIYEREQRLKQTIQSLRIQIDTERQTKEVKEITDSDYFQNLQGRVRQIRQRAHPASAPAETPDSEKKP